MNELSETEFCYKSISLWLYNRKLKYQEKSLTDKQLEKLKWQSSIVTDFRGKIS